MAVTRISLGWILLWTFFDATFALGFPTGRGTGGSIDYLGDAAWVNGGSPTAMLETMAKGPFAGFFRDIAGDAWLDWLFMSVFLVAGMGLVLGIGVRLAAIAGSALFVVAWMAVSIWPADNPFLNQHLVYAATLMALAGSRAGDTWGFGRRWAGSAVVARHPILK